MDVTDWIRQVELLKLEPGDVLVVRFTQNVPHEFYEDVRVTLGRELPGVTVIPVGCDDPIQFTAIRPPGADVNLN